MTTVRHGARLLPLAVAAAVVVPAVPAAAHTELVRTSVSPGAAVPATTSDVVLTFSGKVRPELSAVVVSGPDGDGTRGRLELRGRDVVQRLAAPLTPGAWTVSYRVVAADGHPITGTLPFTVAPAAAASTAGPPTPASSTPGPTSPAAPPSSSPAAAASPDSSPGSSREGLAPALPVAGLAAGAGLVGLLLLRRRRP